MIKLAKKLSSKAKRVLLSVGTGVLAAATMAIGAFAEEPAAGTGTAQDLSSIVNTAGTTLKDQFIILVNTLVCDMNFNSYYLLEIVDVQSDTVVSSAMFVYTGKDSGKIDLGGPFGNGSNHKNDNFISVDYEYKEGNNVDDGILTPDQDGTLPNLPNGIKDETYIPSGNYNLSNLDISDIFSSLNQATASVGAFFQATLNIIPITIMTLILGSLALLIVLRILGR